MDVQGVKMDEVDVMAPCWRLTRYWRSTKGTRGLQSPQSPSFPQETIGHARTRCQNKSPVQVGKTFSLPLCRDVPPVSLDNQGPLGPPGV
jgi:hypothetical protein